MSGIGTLDRLQLALPPYLGEDGKHALLSQLRRYPDNLDYYGAVPGETEPLQGDAWRSFVLVDFDSADREAVVGLVISNSCDITRDNAPEPDQSLLFAPVLSFAGYLRALAEEGKTPEQIASVAAEIRRQGVHRIFYLPAAHGRLEESIVLLDAVHAQPLRAVPESARTKLFSLSMYGWYVLLVKLSIHFTRMQENVPREDLALAGV